jgi:hypothetical protein
MTNEESYITSEWIERRLQFDWFLFTTDSVWVLSYITTDGQSVSLSWYQAHMWGLWPDFYYCQTLAGLFIWGALSDKRTDLSFTIAAVFASAVILRSESRGDHDLLLLSQIWDSPILEDQVPVFISPRNRVARLYPQALGDSISYVFSLYSYVSSLYNSGTNRIEVTISNSSRYCVLIRCGGNAC